MSSITLEGTRFRVVPDTGSTNLLVTGSKCINCDSSDGVFDMSKGIDISGGQFKEVAYGGGQQTLYVPWRGNLDIPNNQLIRTNASGGTQNATQQIDFGVIVDNTSPDGLPLNVLGLSSKGFLSSVCGEHTIIFDFPRNTLSIGKNTTFANNSGLTAPIRVYPSPYNVPFVLIKVKSISVNGTPVNASILPQYLLIDTGTTSTITNSTLAAVLVPGRVDITVEGMQGQDVVLTFNNRRDDVEVGKLQVSNAMIVGNQWLQSYAVAFQYDAGTLQFSK